MAAERAAVAIDSVTIRSSSVESSACASSSSPTSSRSSRSSTLSQFGPNGADGPISSTDAYEGCSRHRPWWKEVVCYQVWPMSFKDSNSDGIGDIRGIISKLDYLKELGIDLIWISPTYESPMEDWGYDISNYEDIHEDFGTLQDMEDLIIEVHARGMRILLDLVITHVSSRHPWFVESSSSCDNVKADWFIWAQKRPNNIINGDLVEEPSNWRAAFGGSAWTWMPERQQYYIHLFLESQPDLNWHNPDVREAVYQSAIRFWLDRGVDGFRLDTANRFGKHPDFPDVISKTPVNGKWQPGRSFYVDRPEMHGWLKELRARIDRDAPDKEIVLLGELPHTSYERALKYVVPSARELHMIFDFDVVKLGNNDNPDEIDKHDVAYYTDGDASFTLPLFKDQVEKVQRMITETDAWGTVFMENHDQCRSIARYATGDPRYWNRAGKLLALLQTTLSGTEFIYQGQEIGMLNMPANWMKADFRDRDSIDYIDEYCSRHKGDPNAERDAYRGVFKVGRDNARTPMQWTAEPNAGFTTGAAPWIRVNDNYTHINVQAQQQDSDSIWRFWQARIAMRKKHRELFMFGSFTLHDRDNEQTFTYTKLSDDGQMALVVLNFSDRNVALDNLPKKLLGACSQYLTGNVEVAAEGPGQVLQPWEGRVYMAQKSGDRLVFSPGRDHDVSAIQ